MSEVEFYKNQLPVFRGKTPQASTEVRVSTENKSPNEGRERVREFRPSKWKKSPDMAAQQHPMQHDEV